MKQKSHTIKQIFSWWFLFTTLVSLSIVLAACQPQPTPTESPEAPPPTEEPVPTEVAPTEPETEPTQAAPELSQPIARWNSVTEKGDWVLIGYGDALNPTVVEPGTYVTINFSPTDDQVTGSGGCNNYFATYSANDNGNLTINGPIGSTMMACETGMEQESTYLAALENATGYQVTEAGRLLISYDSGAGYLEQLVYDSETPLIGTLWVLTVYGDVNNPTPTQPGVMTTAVFLADGTVNGSAGCNQYSAGYSLQDNQISITAPASTMMACEIGMDQEYAYLTNLENAQSYRILGAHLEITYAAGAGVLRYTSLHQPLENVRWVLNSIAGQPLPDGVTAYAIFSPAPDVQENQVNGHTGCNSFFGTYTVAGDNLSIPGPLGVIQMMCTDDVMQVQQAFLAGLENAQSYATMRNQLTITADTGFLVFYADRVPLEVTQWVLTSLGSLDNPRQPVAGAGFTATFSRQSGMPSGLVTGSTGCNDYTAAYYATLQELKVNLPQTTQYTCSDAITEEEQAYFLGLNSARDYRILGNELQVFYDDQVLTFTATFPPPEAGPLASLDGTQWWLTSIDDTAVLPGSEVTAQFAIDPDGSTGLINGSAGCNNYNAEITGVFTVGPAAAATLNCDSPAGIMEQESAYLSALEGASSFALEGARLSISTSQGMLLFSNQGPSAEQPLPPTATPEAGQPLPTPEALLAVINAPTEGQVNQLINFDGSASTPQAGIASFQWDFADGTEPVEGAIVEHTFTSAGTFTITLTVSDPDGNTNSALHELEIN